MVNGRVGAERTDEPAARKRRCDTSSRLWREWCFVRAAFIRFRGRLLLIAVILLGGGLLFQRLEPEKGHSLLQAMYFTWALVFGEPPEAFPQSHVLQLLFFAVPVLGLTVIIEGIVDLAFLLRDRKRYERGWCCMMASSMSGHVVLVGFGKLGFRTFLHLRDLGSSVVVIERDPGNQFLEDVRQDGSPLLIGDARREAILHDANIAKARAIVLATDDDLTNLEVALDAQKIAPDIRVVLRMFDQNMADKVADSFNIHVAMSQSAISAPAFATVAVEPSVISGTVVGENLIAIQRWHVRAGGPLCGKTVADVMVDYHLGVTEHRSKAAGATLFPPPDTPLVDGDELLVQGTLEGLKSLKIAVSGVV